MNKVIFCLKIFVSISVINLFVYENNSFVEFKLHYLYLIDVRFILTSLCLHLRDKSTCSSNGSFVRLYIVYFDLSIFFFEYLHILNMRIDTTNIFFQIRAFKNPYFKRISHRNCIAKIPLSCFVTWDIHVYFSIRALRPNWWLSENKSYENRENISC